MVTQGDLNLELVEGFDAVICGLWRLGKPKGWNILFPRATPVDTLAQLPSLYVFYLKVLRSFPGTVAQCGQIEHQRIAQSPGVDLFIKAD